MATLSREDVRHLDDWTVMDPQGQRLGKLDDVYLDAETGEPEWGVVKSGLFGMREHLVPLANAEKVGNDAVRVAYGADKINSAPAIDEDRELSKQEEQQLSSYYGLQYTTKASPSGMEQPSGMQGQARMQAPQGQAMAGQGQASAQAGRQAPDAMTRSEEELHVGKMRHPSELVRLRKTIVTEAVDTKVPIAHEEVRIEREPITDANMGKAMEGPALKEDTFEVTLMAEEPVVDKQVVPKERIHLEKYMVTDEQPVHAELRKEKIDIERDKDVQAKGRADIGQSRGQAQSGQQGIGRGGQQGGGPGMGGA